MSEKLTPQQQMAVVDRGGKLLVSAAAGSGKTKVLVDRLIRYLNDPVSPANLDDFLIITYTKAAASELRGKIASKLTELIAKFPENRHLRQQMQRLYLTKICTVHSFCGDVLREFAFNLDIAPDFRVCDENEALQLQLQVMDKILDDAYNNAADDPDFCAFIDTQGLGRDDRQIPQIILSVYQSARCHLDPNKWLQWCCDATETAGINDAAETVWGKYLVDDLRLYLDLQIKALSKCAQLADAAVGMEKPAALLNGLILQLEHLRDASSWDEVLARKNIDYGRLTFSKKCTDLELAERIKAIRNACKSGLEKKLVAFSDSSDWVLRDLQQSSAAARGLIALTKRFSDEYEKRKRSRRILDFADLEHRILDLLLGKTRTGYTSIARELNSRFREIMVDEYQDSNAVQDAIFEALTFKNNNCFMVGDVKQSIYQFRLADPEIFVEKYNTYRPAEEAAAGEGRKVLLSSNFRSSNGIISAVNDVFSQCMSEAVGGLTYGDEERLVEGLSHISIHEPEVELYGLRVREDTYVEEASFVAERVAELLDGSHMIRAGEELRPITEDDIVILLRSPGSVGAQYMYALEHRGIRCTTGGSVDLLQTEEISALRSFLQVISNPLQDIPLIAVLTGKIVGLTADEIAQIRSNDKYCSIYAALQTSDNPKVSSFLEMLAVLRTEARLYPLPELLQKILSRTRMDSIYAAMPDGANRLANLQTFCQIAADFEGGGQKDLAQFLDHLNTMEQKGLVYAGQLQESGAVTIMSIHKSKGLEFPVVFLCGLSRRFNQENARSQVLCHKDLGIGLNCVDPKNRIRYPSVAKRAISARIIADGISEELRVLYVAMTRPRDRLIMVYSAGNLESDIQDIALRIDFCDPVLLTSTVSCPGDWVMQSAMRRVEAGEFFTLGGRPDSIKCNDDVWRIKVVEAPESITEVSSVSVDEVEISEKLIDKLKESLSFKYAFDASTKTPSKQTATQLKGRYKDTEVAENTKQVYKHTFRKAGFSKPEVTSADIGTAVHRVLQLVDYSACVNQKTVELEIHRLLDEGLITQQQFEMVDARKLTALFESTIGQQLNRSNKVLREFKFSILNDAASCSDGIPGDEILLQGVVDCAFSDDDGITILDYKTDYVTESTLNEKIDLYKPQVYAYANALHRIFRCPVKAVYLYFFALNRFVKVDI